MDFDDLDDVIEERMAAGDTEGLEQFAAPEKKVLKPFASGRSLPPIPKTDGLFVDEPIPDKPVRMRAFVFYGPGDVAQDFARLICNQAVLEKWLEFGIHEWPGHGSRSGEPHAEDLDALAQDAFDAIKPALEQVKEDGEYEGAPFAFVGSSVGAQLITLVAKKVLFTYRMAPICSVIMNRGAPQFSMLSDQGSALLDSDPAKLMKAFNYKDARFGPLDKDSWVKDMRYGCETRDQFYHKLDCDVLLLQGTVDKSFLEKRKERSKYKMTTMQIKGKKEFFQMPVDTATTVSDLMKTVGSIFGYSRNVTVKACSEDGKELSGMNTVGESLVVEGLEDFKHPRYTWPHPTCIIGGGFFGIKMAMEYHLHKNHNIVLFDRLKEAGGYAWHLSATKHSRCQTDFGAFNIWWGHEFSLTGDEGYGTEKGGRAQFTKAFLGPGSPIGGTIASGAGTGVDYHPVRHQILAAMRYALKEYNAEECCHFETEVNTLQIVGDKDWEGRCYKLGLKSLKENPDPDTSMKVSVIYHFPGAYDVNRIVDYPGESEFGGQIGYGMGNGNGVSGIGGGGQFVWDNGSMKGTRAAILGNGAFAVENVRSCAENGASKIYIITRRKSLLCPRLPCWFCHQGPAPTPAAMLLDMFKTAYETANQYAVKNNLPPNQGIEDPWTFYAVFGNEKRTVCTLKQSSRFGIGDVTFLCAAIGMLEYRVDTLARCSYKTMHLTGGEKLEDMSHICKALGLLGDPRVDQLHAMTHRVGNWVNGDWRRCISADATGMDAMRFTTFSAGPGAAGYVKNMYYMHNHPWEYRTARANPDFDMLPIHKISATQPDQTVYITNVQYEMQAGNMIGNLFPLAGRCQGDESLYKYSLIHTMHPTDKFIDYCKKDWDRYQDLFKSSNPGFENMEKIAYPYTKEQVDGWFERYTTDLKIPISPEGPNDAVKKKALEDFKFIDELLAKEMIPDLIKEAKLLPNVGEKEDFISEAMATAMYQLLKDVTPSANDSALEFDDAQFEAWKECIAEDYKFEAVPVEGLNKEMLGNYFVWPQIIAYMRERCP